MLIIPTIPVIGRYEFVSSGRISTGTTPIDPTTLSPVQWFDAQTATTILSTSGLASQNGGLVSTWNTKVGGFSAYALTEGTRPTYITTGIGNKPSIHFNGSTSFTHLWTRGAGKLLTIFVVMSSGPAIGYRGVYSTNDSGSTNGLMALSRLTTTGNFGTYGTQEWPSNVSLADKSLNILVWQRTGDDGNMYYNSVSAGYFGNTVGQSGHIGGAGGQNMTGLVGEIIAYDKVLTVPEILGVTAYLNARWS